MTRISKHLNSRTRFLRIWQPGRKVTALIGIAGAVFAIGGGVGGYALASSSGPSTVTASIQVSGHPDTTSGGAGTACTSSPGGPVWANDSYTVTLAAVPAAATNTWNVTLSYTGTFAGFADPNTCDASPSKGAMIGLYTINVVTSAGQVPSAANLAAAGTPAQAGALGNIALTQKFFGDPNATATGGDYFFVYQGGNYVQTTKTIYGDVVPTVTLALPATLTTTHTATSVTASWSAVDGVPAGGAYDVEFINAHNGAMLFHGLVNGTSLTIAHLITGTHYAWRIAAISTSPYYVGTGWSAWQEVYPS